MRREGIARRHRSGYECSRDNAHEAKRKLVVLGRPQEPAATHRAGVIRFAKVLTRPFTPLFCDLTATAAGSIVGSSFFRLPPATGRRDGKRIKTVQKRTTKTWRGEATA